MSFDFERIDKTEMDKEDEGELAQLERQLNCMGTEDEETLIRQFQQLLAPHADLSPDLCRFFLDMNNWNLQEALGSFYDYNAQQMIFHSLPSMQFVADITVGEGESVQPNSRFVKTWRIRNNGTEQWSVGSCLRHIEGDLLADADHVDVETLKPGEMSDVSVTMTSPSQQGTYQSRWRMFTGSGLPFGETIWCIIVVDNSGLLDLTQRLASANCGGQQHPTPSQWSFGAEGIGAPFNGASSGNESQRNPFQSGIRHDESHQPHIGQEREQKSFGVASVSANMESIDGSSRSHVISLPYGQTGIPAVNAETTASFAFEPVTTLNDMRPNELWTSANQGRTWRGWDGSQPQNSRTNPDVPSTNNDDSPEDNDSLGKNKVRTGLLAPALTNMSAVSVIQPLQPLYGAPSTDDDMEN